MPSIMTQKSQRDDGGLYSRSAEYNTTKSRNAGRCESVKAAKQTWVAQNATPYPMVSKSEGKEHGTLAKAKGSASEACGSRCLI